MIDCEAYYELLRAHGFSHFVGVPDSLLKDFCACITNRSTSASHIIAANEGAAISLAAGYHLATGKISIVYMQNSGLGNAVNPLTSLVDRDVYSIPLLLFIGWRGEPNFHDEPQHVKMGRVTINLLETLGIPHEIHATTLPEAEASLQRAVESMRSRNAPYALIIRKGTFSPYCLKTELPAGLVMSREEAIIWILESIQAKAIFVSTTGMASREVFEFRHRTGAGHHMDFLTVGSMGHASQIALGIAQSKPDLQVFCLDGDGALLMHMGSLAIIGAAKAANFKHVVLNNGAHDSVGGQPTVALSINIPQVALACGYRSARCVEGTEELTAAIQELQDCNGPALVEVRVTRGARPDLGRPTKSPLENKREFMAFLAAS